VYPGHQAGQAEPNPRGDSPSEGPSSPSESDSEGSRNLPQSRFLSAQRTAPPLRGPLPVATSEVRRSSRRAAYPSLFVLFAKVRRSKKPCRRARFALVAQRVGALAAPPAGARVCAKQRRSATARKWQHTLTRRFWRTAAGGTVCASACLPCRITPRSRPVSRRRSD
jgi:hypothetical protein